MEGKTHTKHMKGKTHTKHMEGKTHRVSNFRCGTWNLDAMVERILEAQKTWLKNEMMP